MIAFQKSRWYSTRVEREVTLARWGHFGQPVLVFPTAGGDAEEIQRWQMIDVLSPLIEAGRIKIYSCDSVAGQAWFANEGSLAHRMWLMNQFQRYVRHEVVPAIHSDCHTEQVGVWVTGASIGAMHAVAVLGRFPDVFERALGMSGSYDLMRFTEANNYSQDYHHAAPMRFLPLLGEGKQLDLLRTRSVTLASGAGRAENMGESWGMAEVLGARGIPNRVDPWGEEWPHDWQTWRAMLPSYLAKWTA